MIQQFIQNANRLPDKTCFEFCAPRSQVRRTLSYGMLLRRASKVANAMPVKGDPARFGVLICCREEEAFIVTLLAVLMRGAVAIPAAETFGARVKERNQCIATLCQADLICHDFAAESLDSLSAIAKATGSAELFDVVAAMESEAGEAFPDPVPGAILQFSSGSVADPKPILLGPSQIAASCQHVINAFDINEGDIGAGWVPLNHDMGLIGNVLVTLTAGATTALMQPIDFLQAPLRWFDLVSAVKATTITGPNFAFELVCKAIEAKPETELDLSSLRNVIIGSEPVQRGTVDRLCALFERFGLSPDAICPSYGMAEVGLLVSAGRTRTSDWYYDSAARRFLPPLGQPAIGIEVCINDPETGRRCAEEEIGEIVLSGAGVGTRVASGSDWRTAEPDASLRTGDFGFTKNRQLFITGRSSNRIIVRGRNIQAEDVEHSVHKAAASVPLSCIAAVGQPKEGTEEVLVFIELSKGDACPSVKDVHAYLGRELGVKASRLVFLTSPAFPRTSSGKIRRGALLRLWDEKKLDDRVIKVDR